MESKKLNYKPNEYNRVILRAYENKPLLRYAYKRLDGIIMIRNDKSMEEFRRGLTEAEDDWIGWPISDVYQYDNLLYEKLSNYWEEGNLEGLEALWSSLSPYEF